ncbi:hypothetical protein THMIRHAS_15640 [Thiosulfatimonas sediminis]|uniref:Glycosyl transferase n=1 Tax=Thiosulfatimonas sediminis TaxID=2675054 RepID=A0A6F8PVN8_9GAMM|nr:glycosyl transferase family protein [Thiosulfatimonas sediminis]BBP46191.1 hypothetical protein THMIRHAS_15640 [Thiosulfatimonas sediminis]
MSDHPFSQFLRILGKGPRSRRCLEVAEAQQAMQMLLQGQVSDKQLGAFLLLMRANGESQTELLGFMQAVQAQLAEVADFSGYSVDVNWVSYSGKWRYPPYFLLALKLLAENGYRVLLHGDSGQFAQRAYAEQWLESLGIASLNTESVGLDWQSGQVNYLAIGSVLPMVRDLLHLKEELGVRTVFNTLVKLLNPMRAPAAVQGIYHKGVEQLHHAAAQVNHSRCNLVFKGEGGEAEIRPDALIKLFFSLPNQAEPMELKIPAVIERQVRPESWQHEDLVQLWQGQKNDLYGTQSVICTAAVGLMCIALADSENPVTLLEQANFFEHAYQTASQFWQQRSGQC